MTGDCHVRFCERLRGETPLCLLGDLVAPLFFATTRGTKSLYFFLVLGVLVTLILAIDHKLLTYQKYFSKKQMSFDTYSSYTIEPVQDEQREYPHQ